MVLKVIMGSIVLLVGTLGTCPAQANREQLKGWLADLRSADAKDRQIACVKLKQVVTQIERQASTPRLSYAFPVAGIVAEESQTRSIDQVQLQSWRQEISANSALIKSLLKSDDREDPELFWELLVIADPTADFLANGHVGLFKERQDCWDFYQALLTIGTAIAPRDCSVLKSTVQLLHQIDSQERQAIDSLLNAEPENSLLGVTTAGIAIEFVRRDRIQCELESLGKLLGPENPNVLRLMSLQVIAELGAESRPVEPSITRLLSSKDLQVRRNAAFTLAAIQQEDFDPVNVSERARLSNEDKLLLKNTHRDYVEDAKESTSFIIEELTSEQIARLLDVDETNVGRRSILRVVIKLIQNSDKDVRSLRPAIIKQLEWVRADQETKWLAKRTLSQLSQKGY